MGARKLARARSLHAAGFTPEVAGFRHGFLVERWIDGAVSLDQGSATATGSWSKSAATWASAPAISKPGRSRAPR